MSEQARRKCAEWWASFVPEEKRVALVTVLVTQDWEDRKASHLGPANMLQTKDKPQRSLRMALMAVGIIEDGDLFDYCEVLGLPVDAYTRVEDGVAYVKKGVGLREEILP